jgi:hypothetical protein
MLSAEARGEPGYGGPHQGSCGSSEGDDNTNGPGTIDVVSGTDDCVPHSPLYFFRCDASLQGNQSPERGTIISAENSMT